MAKKEVEEVLANEVEVNEEQEVQAHESEQTNKVITKNQVKERLDSIEKLMKEEHPVVAGQKGHIEQDKLVKEVLEAIAAGAKDPDGLAQAALNVYGLEFTRLYG